MVDINVDLLQGAILVTGCAGFIGSYVTKRLLKLGCRVVGIDNLSPYYDVKLKLFRLQELEQRAVREASRSCAFTFIKSDIVDRAALDAIFAQYRPSIVVNLAAQVGVRWSIAYPDDYIQSNIIGFYNILELCRYYPVRHLVYASSSSVYGDNAKIPYNTEDKVDSPVSLYAATKKSDELLAYAYAKLYKIPCTGLRFFTVYGPAGRPDMAYFGFTDKLVRGDKIRIFGYGKCQRDFTYIDDIAEGVVRVLQHAPLASSTPYKVYNIGNAHPENLLDFVYILAEELIAVGVLPRDFILAEHMDLLPMQPGDVAVTYADVSELQKDFDFRPDTALCIGLRHFAQWYKEFRRLT